MSVIHDEEFGEIPIRRSVRARAVRISVTPQGGLRASMPPYAPLFVLKRLVKSSRPQLRKMLEQQAPSYALEHGAEIGKSHKLAIIKGPRTKVTLSGLKIIVMLAPGDSLQTPTVERMVRDAMTKALRKEAKSYLPRRLSYLAQQHGYSYEKARFSHASSRWGSCSSSGTISLNIALMKLPFELIDYVIIHELCHTQQMNHSQKFWRLVEDADPSYKLHRSLLKKHNPTI